MIKILMVGIGGFSGSICRYLISEFSNKYFTAAIFPYGTLFVNILGCLIIGFLGGISEVRQVFPPEIRALVMVGFLGGFTTYSTFGSEIFIMVRAGHTGAAVMDLFLHIVLGISGVWLGFSMSKLFSL